MAETFAYDLVSFLRVLYRRRRFIAYGALGMMLLAAVASLVWPQTWRANARIYVSTPKFKQTLKLVPEPFDVLTYEAIMRSDRLFQQIIERLRWYREATHQLRDSPAYDERIRARLGQKAEGMTPFLLMQNTNQTILAEFLVPENERENPDWINRINGLGNLSAEELELVFNMTDAELNKMSVFELRKVLLTSVAKVRETNMEVEYSRVIQVSGESGTATGARLITNTWLDLFVARAEETVKGNIQRYIQLAKNRSEALKKDLLAAETKLAVMKTDAQLENLRGDMASRLVRLTGLAPNRRIADQVEESFDLENENEPFMKERRQQTDTLSFSVTPQYADALIPAKMELERNLTAAKLQAEAAANPEEKGKHQARIAEMEAQWKAVTEQIAALTGEIALLLKKIRAFETDIAAQERVVNGLRANLSSMQPLLDEASLLESQEKDIHYADVSVDRAIKPDKRVFPKRSLMTAMGLGLGFFLFCGLAFFLDIWNEVTRGEKTPDTRSS